MLVFVDTAAWIAVVYRKDRHHPTAAEYLKYLIESGAGLVTSNYVTDETITRLRYDAGHKIALRFRQILTKAVSKRLLRVYWVTPEIELKSWEIFKKYDDQEFSFTDCTSFAVCQDVDITDVFTFDRHFTFMGFSVGPGTH